MKRLSLWCVFCIFGAIHSFAATPQERFESANRLFAEGNYTEAIVQYEEIQKKDGVSASLLFNLANAQFKSGRVGKAILNLERARLLRPNDPDIAANLRIIQETSGLRLREIPWWHKQARAWSSDAWALLMFASGFTAMSLLVILMLKKSNRDMGGVRLACGIFTILMLAGIIGFMGRWDEIDDAIVVAPNAVARISPFDTAEVAFPLPEGEKLRVKKRHNDFTLISNPLNQSGWTHSNDIQQIQDKKTIFLW
ncbi:MAG: tetratricopeptide repeat protein [Verrucomicrobiota bacterium]